MENANGNRWFNERNYKSNGFKEITDEELALVLYKHKRWVESDGKNGEQAELIKFNFREKTFLTLIWKKPNLVVVIFSKRI